MRMLRPGVIAIVLTGVLAVPQAHAQTPTDLADLVGARGAGGETQMQARGYQQVRATRVRDQSWTLWWSDVQRACVAIATDDGRYASISRIPEQNCRPGGVATAPPPRPHQPDTLTLVCYGQGEHAVYASHSGYEWNDKRKHYEPTQRTETADEQFQTGVQFEFRDGGGRIHLSGKMIPPLNSGGVDGWWQLEDVRMSPDSITARYHVSGLNRLNVQIDRRTGMVEIKDKPGFSGKCDVGDWGAGRKF
ncbi:hypothetical protein [uncultured Aquincola sp.]|uniref:hypothetical protein n=1 Tax=uncultured Aquincola sp. TaxID=886556 RepID=UPI0032B14225